MAIPVTKSFAMQNYVHSYITTQYYIQNLEFWQSRTLEYLDEFRELDI